MSQSIPPESLEYERYVDRLRRSNVALLHVLKRTRAELQTLFDEDYDYDDIDAVIAHAEAVLGTGKSGTA